MVSYSDNNMYLELYDILSENFLYSKNTPIRYINDDEIFKLILWNNGCGFSDDSYYRQEFFETINNYCICFIYKAKGNEVNEYFDYMEFYGMKYLIIFMDYFKDFGKEDKLKEDDPLGILGNSIYFDAIKKLVDVFISTTTSSAELMGPFLSSTVASNNYRFMGIFIAAKIIDDKIGLKEEDTYLIKYEDLKKMIDKIPMRLLLSGIKYYE